MGFPKLKFINHASYIIESDDCILLHDPWMEGGAFNDGWSLLAKEFSNKSLINYLIDSKKRICIWISHEHGDHFSISFFKEVIKSSLKVDIFFQKTADKRVYSFLKSQSLKVYECNNSKKFELGKNFFLYVFAYGGGDSFCLASIEGTNILNLNDCVVRNSQQAQKIRNSIFKITKKIDILFTQFGYANWIGREADKNLRLDSAKEKLNRILIQNNILNPTHIIPFASFIYFSKKENFYMNYQQNNPKDLRYTKELSPIKDKISFMKPNQEITLDTQFFDKLAKKNHSAENYWDKKITETLRIDLKNNSQNTKSINDIDSVAKKYIHKVNNETLFATKLFEIFKIFNLKPIKINISDLNYVLELSYLSGVKYYKSHQESHYDISAHSTEIYFLLKNEFGWNTLHVSGAFVVPTPDIACIANFFRWQDAIKNGLSFRKPVYTVKSLISYLQKSSKNNNA